MAHPFSLAAMGRAAEAMREAQRAVELDPLFISAHDGAAIAAACGGQYDRTLEEAHKILELDPNDPRAFADLSVGHLQKRMYPEALQDAEKGLSISQRYPGFLAFVAFVHGRLGDMEQAGKLVEEMRAAGKKSPESGLLLATAFVGIGKHKEAIQALEEGYRTRDADMVGVNSSPWLEPLRSEPRFQDLVRRMNFPAVPRPAQ